MNKAIFAHRAWTSLNDHIHSLISDYDDKDGQRWGDYYLETLADEICDEYDKLIPVLEWLEEEFG